MAKRKKPSNVSKATGQAIPTLEEMAQEWVMILREHPVGRCVGPEATASDEEIGDDNKVPEPRGRRGIRKR